MVDLSKISLDQLQPLQFACDHWFPAGRNGKPYSVKSLYRWARHGLRGVKLKVLFTTNSAVTSETAVREFLTLIDKQRRNPVDTSMTEEEMAAAGL